MKIDSRDLRYFETIAELGHLRKASDQLHLSQPALSKCIKRLESSVGAPLFERIGRGIQLTAVGEVLLRQARRLNLMTTAALREVQDFACGASGVVRIGCGPIIAESLMPGLCERVLEQMPGIRLTITLGMNYFLRDELRQGNIDFVLGLVPEADSEFELHPLMDDTVVVAASPAHPLFRQSTVGIHDLLDYQWVLPVAEVASRAWLDRQFRTRGLPLPKAQIEVNATPMMLGTIAHTSLLCFVSRLSLARLGPSSATPLMEIPVAETTLQRKLGLTLLHAPLSPAVERVVELLRGDAQLLGPSPAVQPGS
ncbi:LysR family transcriptional regulator [Frateuria aurantia]